ncbi:MAG: hypothetical protein JWM11_7289, partial [Planctomycetaceae bacterium]|nr:hypothetical protein [Planctomycetaceae bacterium]
NLYGDNQELKRQMQYVGARKDGKSQVEALRLVEGTTPETNQPAEKAPEEKKVPQEN